MRASSQVASAGSRGAPPRRPLLIPAGMAHAIEVSGLTKRFGGTTAVDDLSFSVAGGRVVGFLGPNGAGKTTTLRALLGLMNPTSGAATIEGVAYAQLADPVRTVGAMLDGGMLHPGRSGRNHLRTLARAAGLPDVRVDELLELVGLGDAGRPAHEGLLARDAPAARARRHAARGPARARARRAGQRPRPAGDPLAARLPARARRRGSRGARLQPRAGGGRADGRRGRRDPRAARSRRRRSTSCSRRRRGGRDARRRARLGRLAELLRAEGAEVEPGGDGATARSCATAAASRSGARSRSTASSSPSCDAVGQSLEEVFFELTGAARWGRDERLLASELLKLRTTRTFSGADGERRAARRRASRSSGPSSPAWSRTPRRRART